MRNLAFRDLRLRRLGRMSGASGGGGATADITGLRFGSTLNGRTSTDALKVVGVDALPSGMDLSGRSIIVSSPQAEISNWDFVGYTLDVRAFVWSVSQCLFGNGDQTDLLYFVNGNSNGHIRRLEYCTFTGRGDHMGAGTHVNCSLTGTGASVTAFEVDYIHRCRFLDLTSDAIKTAGSTYWNGQRVEWCYFGPPKNLPNTPTVWNSTTTYALGFCVSAPGSGWNYVSRVADNLNNPLPPGVSKTEQNTFWQGIDPHSDAITTVASIGRTSVRNCLFDWTDTLPGQPVIGNQAGVNNWARVSRNTGTDPLFDQVLFEDCIATFGSDYVGYPVQVANNGLPNWNGPVIFRNVQFQPNANGQFAHPSGDNNTDYWINSSGPAPVGAITTDPAAAPSWTSAPTLSGTPSVGATLTATVGTAAGFPAPFYDLAIQRSDDGLTGWVDVAVDTAQIVLGAGDAGKHFRARVRAWNSSGEAFQVSTSVGPIVAGYLQARVRTNGTARLSATPGGSAQCVTFSGWVNFVSITTPSTPRLIRAAQGFDLFVGSGGQVQMQVFNSAGTSIYNATSAAGVLSAGVLFHIFATYDGNTATPFVAVNGSTIAMTPSTGPLTGALRPNRAHEVLAGAGTAANCQVGDFWLEYGAATRSLSTFWNGGTPPDLTGIGTPQIYLGGAMRAVDWNAGTNLGSAVMTVTSATFTDV